MRHRLILFIAAAVIAASSLARAEDKMDLNDPNVASYALGYLYFVEAGLCQKLTVSEIRFETRLKNWNAGEFKARADCADCYELGLVDGRNLLGENGVQVFCEAIRVSFGPYGNIIFGLVRER